ncbi:MAG: amino acid permease, partial [Chloroflexota bacterium]
AYLFQYFAANYALGSWLGNDVAGKGITAAAASGAPIGDMAIQIGNSMLGGNGFAFMIVLAISVAIAILGTTLAAMNTAVRISFAMAQDNEMPEIMGLMHGKYATPHMGIIAMVVVSAIIGAVGVIGGAVTLTGITLASNLGTFILYGLICSVTVVAFAGRKEFNLFRHGIIPGLGLITNIIMVGAIFVIGIASGGTTAQATYLGLGISLVWLVISVIYFVVNSRQTGKPIIPSIESMRTTSAGD